MVLVLGILIDTRVVSCNKRDGTKTEETKKIKEQHQGFQRGPPP
jgi:hypothetical protein